MVANVTLRDQSITLGRILCLFLFLLGVNVTAVFWPVICDSLLQYMCISHAACFRGFFSTLSELDASTRPTSRGITNTNVTFCLRVSRETRSLSVLPIMYFLT